MLDRVVRSYRNESHIGASYLSTITSFGPLVMFFRRVQSVIAREDVRPLLLYMSE